MKNDKGYNRIENIDDADQKDDNLNEADLSEKKMSEAVNDSIGFIKVLKIAVVIVVVLIGAFVYKSFLGKSEKEADKLAQIALESATETTTEAVGENGVLMKYQEAYAINNDLIGWITVPNTTIDHPVVQSDNDDYYLRRSFYKIYDKRGTIFMESRCHALNLDKNTVLYGHNFLDSTMFSDLEKYKDIEFYKTAPVIEFNTIYKSYKWKVFAVYLINVDAKDDNGYAFCYLYPFMTDDNFEEYVSLVAERSIIKTSVDVKKTDKILTLSTCTRDMDIKGRGQTNARCVVLARLVRDGETLDVDTDSASLNPNPRYPDIWYRANGMENPYANVVNDWVPVGVEPQ